MKKQMDFIKKYLIITIGAVLFGVGIGLFIDPNNLAPGGISGLAIILSRVIPIETGTLFLLVNVPVMVLGAWKFGGKFIASTIYATGVVSFTTNICEKLMPATEEILLAAIFGAVLSAVGMGLVLKNGSTTGGSDIIVKFLKLKMPHMKTGTLFLMIDSLIILSGGLVFGNLDTVLYSALSAVFMSKVLDLVLYGAEGAKLIYIISNYSDRITERILKELEIGVTHLSGSGAYSKTEKQIIFCVVRKQFAYQVEEIVKQEDERAFMIITGASEIYGEGYKSYFVEKV
ncbi:MAG: YitT family protein [Lachnospiraceae bacterium]|nr:YitT family protein [Lachnospiraceae bacterium]